MQINNQQVGDFIIRDQIDSGSFGVCHFAENIHTKQILCAKIIPQSEAAKSEIEILSKVSHPNIVGFVGVERFQEFIIIFMELCEGMTLFDMINTYSRFSEEEAKYVIGQVMSALKYLHSKGISHGDIKMENIICSYDMKIKLIDFGFASETETEMKYRGSIEYSAPEILAQKGFDRKAADIWSAGVCLFGMVAGYLPFQGETVKETVKRVKERKFCFPDFISGETRYMIKSLLQYQPESRMTAEEVLKDEWIVCDMSFVHYVDLLAENENEDEVNVPSEVMR